MDGTAAQGQSEDGYLKVERSSGSGMELLFGFTLKSNRTSIVAALR